MFVPPMVSVGAFGFNGYIIMVVFGMIWILLIKIASHPRRLSQ